MFPTFAKTQEMFDLSQCVISGLENNFSLKIAKKHLLPKQLRLHGLSKEKKEQFWKAGQLKRTMNQSEL